MKKEELYIIAQLLSELETFCYRGVDQPLNEEIMLNINNLPKLHEEVINNEVSLGDLAFIMKEKIKTYLNEI